MLRIDHTSFHWSLPWLPPVPHCLHCAPRIDGEILLRVAGHTFANFGTSPPSLHLSMWTLLHTYGCWFRPSSSCGLCPSTPWPTPRAPRVLYRGTKTARSHDALSLCHRTSRKVRQPPLRHLHKSMQAHLCGILVG